MPTTRWHRGAGPGTAPQSRVYGAFPIPSFPCCRRTCRELDAIDLGCGTGYVSNWMQRRGAHVVGIDPSEKQLDTARMLAGEYKL